MNAQKEAEYMAEIARLKCELKKAEDIVKSGEWISVADFEKYATLDTINALISAFHRKHDDCDYHISKPSKEDFRTYPLNPYEKLKAYVVINPPILTVTRTVNITE